MSKEYNIKEIRSRVSERASHLLNMEVNQNATDVKLLKLNMSTYCYKNYVIPKIKAGFKRKIQALTKITQGKHL